MDSARLFWYIDVTFDKSELRGFTKFHPSILKITTLEVPLNAFLLCHVKLKVSGNRCFSPTVKKTWTTRTSCCRGFCAFSKFCHTGRFDPLKSLQKLTAKALNHRDAVTIGPRWYNYSPQLLQKCPQQLKTTGSTM